TVGPTFDVAVVPPELISVVVAGGVAIIRAARARCRIEQPDAVAVGIAVLVAVGISTRSIVAVDVASLVAVRVPVGDAVGVGQQRGFGLASPVLGLVALLGLLRALPVRGLELVVVGAHDAAAQQRERRREQGPEQALHRSTLTNPSVVRIRAHPP